MTEENPPPPRKLELSSTQVVGSALAAVSAAFFASWLGTAGTLIGAAVGSIVATVGSATYTWWLRRTSAVVRRTAAQVRETGMGSTVVMPGLRTRRPGRAGLDDAPEDSEDEGDTGDASRWAFLRNRPWGKVVLVTAGVLLATLGSVTVVEAVIGKPISALLRGEKGSGTSLGHHTTVKTGTSVRPTEKRTSTPSPSPSVTPSVSSTPTPSPTSTPSPSVTPSVTPSPGASATPTPTPSASSTPGADTAP
jgi:hypothetical protein